MSVSDAISWLLLGFSLPARQGSQRVEIWRKLRRYGALPLPTSGYLLPHTAENRERFEWLAAAIRKYRGQASVAEVRSIYDLPSAQLQQRFVEARSKDYEVLIREVKKQQSRSSAHRPAVMSRLRKRFQEIAAIDFFNSPLRSRAEALLVEADAAPGSSSQARRRKDFSDRLWITRPRPGIDRVASAWLIRRFIDSSARFVFADNPQQHSAAVPFDMFVSGGFGHRGDDCTFETLRKQFSLREERVATLAQIVHDADLADDKFGRKEGFGLDRVLIGWAQQGVADAELLRRGMELIEGLYHSLS